VECHCVTDPLLKLYTQSAKHMRLPCHPLPVPHTDVSVAAATEDILCYLQ